MNLRDRWMRMRNFQSQDFWAMVCARPLTILFLLPIVEKKWVTPNRITVASILTKFAGILFITFDMSYQGGVIGAILVNLGLILDNMDGTVARFRNTCTEFGYYLDKSTDSVMLVLLFWAMGYRGYHFTNDILDLVIPLLGVSGAFVTSYSKWVSEKVLLGLSVSEKYYKNEMDTYIRQKEKGFEWTPPPKRSFTDWIKWLGKAFFSILYFNEVDIFFWAAVALVTEKWWIFTRFDSGFMMLGLVVGPVLFMFKVWKKEKEIKALQEQKAEVGE